MKIIVGVLILLLGLLVLLKNINMVDVGVLDIIRTYWPLLLIVLGIEAIRISQKYRRKFQRWKEEIKPEMETQMKGGEIEISRKFGSYDFNFRNKELRSGKIEMAFGEAKIDIRDAIIPEGNNVLKILSKMGSVKIRANREQPLTIQAKVFMGDVRIFESRQSGFSPEVEYKSDTFESSPSKLTLQIKQSMGEIVVSD
jgi:predicted membrane protein